MNKEQLSIMQKHHGFIAALDQSGGSSPKTLAGYGIDQTQYKSDEDMKRLIHEMRCRVIKSPSFTSKHILGAILFEDTMNLKIDDLFTGDYLWHEKKIIPFLKIDQGLLDLNDGVKLMKDMPNLEQLLLKAFKRNIFGTKMRSVIYEPNRAGIKQLVAQQFKVAQIIIDHGLVPIIEPEVDINAPEKQACETILKEEIKAHLALLGVNDLIMLKLSLPTTTNFYEDLLDDSHIVRIVALSGGYPQAQANELLALNHGLIASFSRALLENLAYQQDETTFNKILSDSIKAIYDASIT
ncbi:MAG: fructose bisphosphate aldolase [Bacilli bacterium]